MGMMLIVDCLRQESDVFGTWTTTRGVEAMDNGWALLDMPVLVGTRPGRTRQPAGRNGGKASGITVAMDVPPPSGLDRRPGNLTI